MKLYVSIPSYGGVLTTRTAAAAISVFPKLLQEGIVEDFMLNFHGEALINRCRNVHSNMALKGGFDKFLTIDSDIEFTYEQVYRLITSPHPIIGGSYPLKCLPPVINFNPIQGKGDELLKTNRGYDLEAFEKYKAKYADHEGLVEVRDLPTGFLCVSMSVFKKLANTAEIYGTFAQESGQREGFFDFYPTRVIDHSLLSEDWGFCHLAREAGFKIMFDTKCITGHVGSHTYRMNQVYGEIDVIAPMSENETG